METFENGTGPLRPPEPTQFEPNSSIVPNTPEPINQTMEMGRITRTLHIAKRSIQSLIIAAELSPVNEAVRFGAFAYSQTQSENPITGAATLGLTTLLVEGSAALATADLLATDRSQRVFGWLNKKRGRFVSNEMHVSPVAEAGLALFGGSVVVMAAKHIENPQRTVEQNRRHGVLTASWMAGFFTMEGALLSEAVQHPSPKTIGAAALIFGGITEFGRRVKNHFIEKKMQRNFDGSEETRRGLL